MSQNSSSEAFQFRNGGVQTQAGGAAVAFSLDYLTGPITIIEPQNQEACKFYLVQERILKLQSCESVGRVSTRTCGFGTINFSFLLEWLLTRVCQVKESEREMAQFCPIKVLQALKSKCLLSGYKSMLDFVRRHLNNKLVAIQFRGLNFICSEYYSDLFPRVAKRRRRKEILLLAAWLTPARLINFVFLISESTSDSIGSFLSSSSHFADSIDSVLPGNKMSSWSENYFRKKTRVWQR